MFTSRYKILFTKIVIFTVECYPNRNVSICLIGYEDHKVGVQTNWTDLCSV